MNTNNTLNVQDAHDIIRQAVEKAIHCHPLLGLEVTYTTGETGKVYPYTLEKKFYMNSGVISWTNLTGQYYLPYVIFGDKLCRALTAQGYTKEYISVELGDGVVPTKLESHWNHLIMEKNRIEYEQDIAKINAIADVYGVLALPQNFLHYSCFLVPPGGITVKTASGATILLRPPYVNIYDFNHIPVGIYCSSNGILAFIDRNGSYYICNNYLSCRETLEKAGFHKKNFPVLFSNGERPVDAPLKKQLEEKVFKKA